MNVLTRLWRAVAGLAESVEALAGTVGEANGRLRQQLALDRPGEARGEVIDNAEALPAPRRAAKKRRRREKRPAGTAGRRRPLRNAAGQRGHETPGRTPRAAGAFSLTGGAGEAMMGTAEVRFLVPPRDIPGANSCTDSAAKCSHHSVESSCRVAAP
jgi:hypothetical protein